MVGGYRDREMVGGLRKGEMVVISEIAEGAYDREGVKH